jgi:NDP-sugar pyrophosphorylase family protein
MRFAIIAAGEGSRLRAEGIATPKPLLPIGGVPLIERLLRLARENGARSVAVIVNATPEAEQVRAFLGSRSFGVPVDLVVKTTPSSVHSVQALLPLMGGEPFCLFTVDAVFREDELRRFLAFAEADDQSAGALALTTFVNDEKPLYARCQGDRIVALEDSRPSGSPEPALVTGGLYYLRPAATATLDESVRGGTSHLRNALRRVLQEGHTVRAFVFSRIVDVDDRSDIEAAEELLAAEERRSPSATVSEA